MAKFKPFSELTDEEFEDFEPKLKFKAEQYIATLGMKQVAAYEAAYDDYRIDHGDRCEWEPTVEEERAARKANKIVGERAPKSKAKAPVKRTRAEDPIKRSLIEALRETLAEYEGVSDLVITNPERVVAFALDGDNYEITLTKKRKAKE